MASEPIENSSSATDTLTEDELLGTAAEADLAMDPEALDEEALLGLESERRSVEEKEETTAAAVGEDSAIDSAFDREELDYDDDDEHEEKVERSKFTSERSKPTKSSSSLTATATSSSTSVTSSGSNFRGRNNNNYNNSNNNRPKPPSLLGMQLPPPAFATGGKILVNPNFIPQPAPMVRLNMPGVPPITMGAPMQPFMARPGGAIVPRLPNGIPLVGLPPNHGVAGFGGPPPQPLMAHPGMMMSRRPGGNWDQAVNAFLNGSGPQPKRARRRSSSYSSYSSYSSRSSSRSRSPRRRRGGHGRERRRSGDRRRDERHRGGESRSSTTVSSRSGRRDDRRERRRDDKFSEECAKAVGVDNDYLSRVEEQKRRREEVVRRKEQRRHGGEVATKPESSRKRSSSHEKKAYLVVVIKNMKHLPTAQEKIRKLAAEVGSITKCWRFNEDSVHLIFADHTDAKTFLTQFNGKVLSGLRMQVNVEKAYLNLAEVEE